MRWACPSAIRATMAELKKRFPPGLDYSIVYDPTVFVKESVVAVGHTLVEAIILVVLVVIVFLQTWRASIIPLIAVPVSLIGTFAVMAMMGFSLNNLSLFGLVLAIGIVVDDAIVVVENVERNIEAGLKPREATFKAMDEVSGPIVAVALVLCAVFVPTAFVSGITGQFYRQFALTIAVTTVLSAFNSLTLSPALAALLLRPKEDKPDWFTRVLNFLFGWFFRAFNWTFERANKLYVRGLGGLIRLAVVALIVYVGLLGLTWLGFKSVPAGFIPSQDQGYLVGIARLPDAASLDRTEDVVARACEMARETPGVRPPWSSPATSRSTASTARTRARFSSRSTPSTNAPRPTSAARPSPGKSSPRCRASRRDSWPCSRRRRCRASATRAASS